MVIYEVGAGNGTLCVNILNYIREQAPHLYEKTAYNIVDISSILSNQQKRSILTNSHSKVTKLHRKSILEWNEKIEEDCFIILNEVLVRVTI